MESIEMKIAKTAAQNWGQAEPQNLEEAKGITWGSEISSIKGIVKVLGLSTEMEEKMIQDVYESDTISPEIAKEIQKRIIGITETANPNIIKMLCTVHDEWVRNNPNNFMKETEKGRRNKEYQFVPLELLSWKEAKSDLLFLKPILEASGIEIDEKQVEEQFEVTQKEFLIEHRIVSRENLRENLQSGSRFYPALEGLETKFGGNIENLLKDQTILEDMVSQVEKQVPIKSREELAKEIIASENPRYDDVMWIATTEHTYDEACCPIMDRPVSEREIALSKLIGKPYPTYILSDDMKTADGKKYKNELRGRYGHEQEIDAYETGIMKRMQEAKKSSEKGKIGFIEYTEYGGGTELYGDKRRIEIEEDKLKKAGLSIEKMGFIDKEQFIREAVLSTQEDTSLLLVKLPHEYGEIDESLDSHEKVISQKEKDLMEKGILYTPSYAREDYPDAPSTYQKRTIFERYKFEDLRFLSPSHLDSKLTPDQEKKIEEERKKREKILHSKSGKYDKEGSICTNLGIIYNITQRELVSAGIDPHNCYFGLMKKITSKDIAEADKETALTTTEVGGIKGLINKIREKFKGKGEK